MDELNRLVVDSAQMLSDYNVQEYNVLSSIYTEGFASMNAKLLPNPKSYVEYMNKVGMSLRDVNTQNMGQLVENLVKINESMVLKNVGYEIQWFPNYKVPVVRLKFFELIPAEFDKVVKGYLGKTIKKEQIKQLYYSDKFFNSYRSMILADNSNVAMKDLLMKNKVAATNVIVTNDFITEVAVPYVNSVANTQNEFNILITNTKSSIGQTYERLKLSFQSVDVLISENKVSMSERVTLSRLCLVFGKFYMNMVAQLCANISRAALGLIQNTINLSNFQIALASQVPNGSAIAENTMDGRLSDIDVTDVVTNILKGNERYMDVVISRAVNKAGMIAFDNNAPAVNDTVPFVDNVYECINRSVMKIGDDIGNIIIVPAKNGILDGRMVNFEIGDKYDNMIKQLSVIANNSDMSTVYYDIANFKDNFHTIAKNLFMLGQLIKKARDVFNTDDTDIQSEYQKAIDRVYSQFTAFATVVVSSLIERFRKLTMYLSAPDPQYADMESVATDYMEDIYEASLDEIAMRESVAIQSLRKKYIHDRLACMTRIDLIQEEVTDAENGTKNQVTTGNDTQKKDEQKNNEEVKKTDNEKREEDKNILDKIKEVIAKIIGKFKETVSKLTSTNDQWISKVKKDILALDFSSTNITVAPYPDCNFDTFNNTINSAITKINAVSAENLPTELKGTKDKAAQYIFSTLPQKVDEFTDLAPKMKQLYTYGNVKGKVLKTYSGDDAKKKVEGMVQYVESYGSVTSQVCDALDRLQEAGAQKQKAISEVLNKPAATTDDNKPVTTKTQVQESVMYEAEVNANAGANTETKVSPSTVITSAIRDYVGAVLSLMEAKYLDYVKVLSNLAPPDKKKTASTTNQETSNNNGETKE